MMDKQYHIFFSGMVQNVGFRFITRSLANRYGVRGWVKNLSDGRVEAMMQGEGKSLDKLICDLRAEFGTRLDNFKLEEMPPSAKFERFSVISS